MDAQIIIRAVNRAEEAWQGLEDVRGQLRHRTGPAVTLSRTSPAPVDLAMLDLARDIRGSLYGWCQVHQEEVGDEWPEDTVPGVARWLRARAVDIAGADWAPDAADELEHFAARAMGMLGQLTPRTPLPEPCAICGARQWAWHERPPIVRCRGGHESQLIEHLGGRGIEAVTQAQAAWVLGCSRRAISRAIACGELAAGTHGGVTVKSLRERLAS